MMGLLRKKSKQPLPALNVLASSPKQAMGTACPRSKSYDIQRRLRARRGTPSFDAVRNRFYGSNMGRKGVEQLQSDARACRRFIVKQGKLQAATEAVAGFIPPRRFGNTSIRLSYIDNRPTEQPILKPKGGAKPSQRSSAQGGLQARRNTLTSPLAIGGGGSFPNTTQPQIVALLGTEARCHRNSPNKKTFGVDRGRWS